MGSRKLPEFLGTDDSQMPQDWDQEAFLHQLKGALLLALLERGLLSPMQYRHAEEKLRKLRRNRARGQQEEP